MLLKHELPTDYSVRPCNFCGGNSLDETPFPAAHPDRGHWGGLEPWANGTKTKPAGNAQRLYLNIWHDGGFAAKYKNHEQYTAACRSDATLNSDFMHSRKKLIAIKLANPGLRMRNKEALVPARFLKVTRGSASRMKRKKKFIKLEKWEKQHQKKAAKSAICVKKWHGKNVRGIMVEADLKIN
jgi:hypothetical protein